MTCAPQVIAPTIEQTLMKKKDSISEEAFSAVRHFFALLELEVRHHLGEGARRSVREHARAQGVAYDVGDEPLEQAALKFLLQQPAIAETEGSAVLLGMRSPAYVDTALEVLGVG